jgi:NADPH2:quinone reductase
VPTKPGAQAAHRQCVRPVADPQIVKGPIAVHAVGPQRDAAEIGRLVGARRRVRRRFRGTDGRARGESAARPGGRHVVATGRGGPETLVLAAGPVPDPGHGQVRIRVRAAGVGFPDLLMVAGTYPGGPRPPFTPGYDVVGTVDAVGPGTIGPPVGATVAALTVWGGYAETVCIPAWHAVPVPEGLDPVDAVCLVLNYTTAWQMLHRVADARPGELLLVQGAAGGVGSAALQLAAERGLAALGTASADDLDLVARLGATPLDRRLPDLVGAVRVAAAHHGRAGPDVVLDGIGGTTALRSYRMLRSGGRLVLFGHHATLRAGRRDPLRLAAFYTMGAATLAAGRLVPDGCRVLTYQIARLRDTRPDWFRDDLTALFMMLAKGRIAPVVADRVHLSAAADALAALAGGRVRGKLVLVT